MIAALLLAQAVQLHGFVDADFALDTDRPRDPIAFANGAGTTAHAVDQFRLDLALVDLSLDPAPVGFRVTLAYGEGIDVLHAAEPFLGPVYQAYLSVKALQRLTIDAGIFQSHVGLESLYSKDNFNYTRSWMGEFSPYYQAGLRFTYAPGEHWTLQLHLLNGWQLAGDDNRAKTIGAQVAYANGPLSLAFNTLIGPELPGDDSHWRFFGDLVASWKVLPALTLAGTMDAAYQQGTDSSWVAGAVYARQELSKLFALALRLEDFHDPQGSISGTPQTLREGTLTFEARPFEALICKLEARHDLSTASVFHSRTSTTETLVIASAVATF